jgi:hypothetical protein
MIGKLIPKLYAKAEKEGKFKSQKLAGIDTAKSEGFTHTNPAKTDFDTTDNVLRKPRSVIKRV